MAVQGYSRSSIFVGYWKGSERHFSYRITLELGDGLPTTFFETKIRQLAKNQCSSEVRPVTKLLQQERLPVFGPRCMQHRYPVVYTVEINHL